jgi:hypothetical protein
LFSPASPPLLGHQQTGLAWHAAPATGSGSLRHSCEHGDKLQRWGWRAFDAGRYGLEALGDAEAGVDLAVEWLVNGEAGSGGGAGGLAAAVAAAAAAAAAGAAAGEGGARCEPWVAVINGTEPARAASTGGARRKGAKKARADAPGVALFSYVASPHGKLDVLVPTADALARGHPAVLTGSHSSDGGKTLTPFALLVRVLEGAPPTRSAARTHETPLPSGIAGEGGAGGAAATAPGARAEPLPELRAPRFATARLDADDVWRVEDVIKGELKRSARAAASAASVARSAASRAAATAREAAAAAAAAAATGGAEAADAAAAAALKEDAPDVRAALEALSAAANRALVPLLNNSAALLGGAGGGATGLSDVVGGGDAPNLAILQHVLVPPFRIEWTFLPSGCFASRAAREAIARAASGGAADDFDGDGDGDSLDLDLDAPPSEWGPAEWHAVARALGVGERTLAASRVAHREG